jgi:magnesium chelatase accessory protein
MSGLLRWEEARQFWPNAAHSSFVEAQGLRWHVQQAGDGPVALLIHGTGASTHSWRDVLPLLARSHRVIALDLPGHGFTTGRLKGGATLPGMARAVAGLLQAMEVRPDLIVGHSAGAAIGLQHGIETGGATPLVGLNPAVMPFGGAASLVFPAMARMLFVNPLATRLFAGMSRLSGDAQRFLSRSTNSRIDALGLRCYSMLLGSSAHCRGALDMMANWDLESLRRRLPKVASPVLLVHADKDNAVPLASVKAACRLIPGCRFEMLPDAGHLAHEERPQDAVRLVQDFAERPSAVAQG